MDLTVLTDQTHQHYQKVPMAHWDHSDQMGRSDQWRLPPLGQRGRLDLMGLNYLPLWDLMGHWVQTDP